MTDLTGGKPSKCRTHPTSQICPGLRTHLCSLTASRSAAFYDAVVGPAFRTVELQISADRTGQVETSVTARLGAGLTALFPWLKLTPTRRPPDDDERSAGRREHRASAGRERYAAVGGLPCTTWSTSTTASA